MVLPKSITTIRERAWSVSKMSYFKMSKSVNVTDLTIKSEDAVMLSSNQANSIFAYKHNQRSIVQSVVNPQITLQLVQGPYYLKLKPIDRDLIWENIQVK